MKIHFVLEREKFIKLQNYELKKQTNSLLIQTLIHLFKERWLYNPCETDWKHVIFSNVIFRKRAILRSVLFIWFLLFSEFLVLQKCHSKNKRQKQTNKENWISSSLLAPGDFSFESTTEIRPERICRRWVWPSSCHTWTCRCCTLNNFYKKSWRSITCQLVTLIWSSSCSFSRQEIRVRLVSLAHQPCIYPSYCYPQQKFGSSISAGSFIGLISQSNPFGSRKNEPVWCSLLAAVFFFSKGH